MSGYYNFVSGTGQQSGVQPSQEELDTLWRSIFVGARRVREDPGLYVRRWPELAIRALSSPLAKDSVERFELFDHVLRLGYSNWAASAADLEAWTAAMNACEEYWCLYKRDTNDAFFPLPSCPVRHLHETEEEELLPLDSPDPVPSPAKPKAKRGRKPGSKDVEPRATRGTLKHLSRAERSRLWREKNKQRKAELQEKLQQQQQTPPA